jgi:hypothetical protein
MYEQGNAKYFKFRELNGSNYNVVGIADIPYDFYALIPEPFKMAYQEMWRSRLWLSGKVPGIHTFLLSSNIGSTIASMFANRVVGGNGLFDGENVKINSDMEDWARKDDFKSKISQLEYCNSGVGQSLHKINIIKRKGKLVYSTEVLSGDRFFIKTVGSEVEKVTIFSNFYQDTNKGNGKHKDYYLEEIREYNDDGEPIGYYNVVENVSIFTEGVQTSFQTNNYNFRNVRDLGKDAIKEIADKLGIEPTDLLYERKLPFKLGLGVAFVKNSYVHPRFMNYNIGCSDIMKVSEDTLVTYELFTSMLSNEGSVTIPLVMLPKRLYNPNIDKCAQFISLDERFSPASQGAVEGQKGYAVINNSSRKIDGTYITYVESEDPENQEPKLVQFNMRMEDIDKGIQRTVMNICNNLEISPFILDPRLRGSSQYKNKQEISLDEDQTATTITNKRSMIEKAINYIVKEVLLSKGYKENDCSYVLARSKNTENDRELTETLILQIQNGLTSVNVARKKIHNTMSKEQFNSMVKEIKTDKEDKLKEEIEKQEKLSKVNGASNDDKMAKKNENLQKGNVGNANVNSNTKKEK